MYQEHYVEFEATEFGERSRCLFIESVPKDWKAEFDEPDYDYLAGRAIVQPFRTPSRIDEFVATSLATKVQRVVHWSWNSEYLRK